MCNSRELRQVLENTDIDIDSAPLWLYILNEAERLPLENGGEKCKSRDTLGPLASLIIAETLCFCVKDGPISVYKSWSHNSHQLGGLSDLYNELMLSSERLSMGNLINFFKLNTDYFEGK